MKLNGVANGKMKNKNAMVMETAFEIVKRVPRSETKDLIYLLVRRYIRSLVKTICKYF